MSILSRLSEQGEHLDQLAVAPDADSLRTLARRIGPDQAQRGDRSTVRASARNESGRVCPRGFEIDRALGEAAESVLHAVDEALKRIDDGTYGTCTNAGKPISAGRLEARPYAALCMECV